MRYRGLDVHVPLGRPRFFEISAAAPPALYARYRRSTWRTLRPSRWATSVCVTRRWWTCSIHSARSNSRRLIVRVPRSMAGPIGRTRHFYLGETRHFHFGPTNPQPDRRRRREGHPEPGQRRGRRLRRRVTGRVAAGSTNCRLFKLLRRAPRSRRVLFGPNSPPRPRRDPAGPRSQMHPARLRHRRGFT